MPDDDLEQPTNGQRRQWDLIPLEMRERLRDATPDSAIGRARSAGIDVAALAIRISTTTELERLAELDRRLEDIARLRGGMS